MHILFITSNYPTPQEPNRGTFVRQLVREISSQGIKCSVICPVSSRRMKKNLPTKLVDNYKKNNPIEILYPRFISYSNKNILKYNSYRLTINSFNRSVTKALQLLNSLPTIVYGHFLYPAGYASARIGKKLGIPSFVAVGESSTKIKSNVEKTIGVEKTMKHFESIDGIISVSSQNTMYCRNIIGIPNDKIKEFPNGIDNELFRPRNKKEMRIKHSLPVNETIVAFTGLFIERKGPHRLLQAIQNIEGVRVMFIGKGPIQLVDEKIVFQGVLEHDEVPEYLSAADMFVLPTLAEGSCNAIIEAMGCGLPVISSDGEFNDDILNSKVSIRVNHLKIDEIIEAINILQNNKERKEKIDSEAYIHSKNFNINTRANNILNWIQKVKTRYEDSKK